MEQSRERASGLKYILARKMRYNDKVITILVLLQGVVPRFSYLDETMVAIFKQELLISFTFMPHIRRFIMGSDELSMKILIIWIWAL